MRDELIRYIDLLFAGAPEAAEIKQEILQNTLDRYDDLIKQGKAPGAAYRLAISGIGDINEILSGNATPADQNTRPAQAVAELQELSPQRKMLRAVAIALYIICPLPLFLLQDERGLCGLLIIVAVATALIVLSAGKKKKGEAFQEAPTPQQKLRSSISSVIWTVCVIIYLAVSFSTQAWGITWVLFPLTGAIEGLITALMDLKEAKTHEN